MLDLLSARHQLALGPGGPAERLIVLGAVTLRELGLLDQVPPFGLGHTGVMVLVPPLKLDAAPVLRLLQLRDPALLLLEDVALAPILGCRQLLLVTPAQAHHLLAVRAVLGLRLGLVGLALRCELKRLLLLEPRDRLLVIAPQLEQLRLEPLGGRRELFRETLLQPLDLGPMSALQPHQLGLVDRLLGRLGGRPLVGRLLEARPPRLLEVRQLVLEVEAQLLGLDPHALDLLGRPLPDRLDLVLALAQLLVRVVQPRLQALFPLDRLLLVLGQLLDLLVRRDQALLETERPLVEVAAGPLELADLVLVIEDQTLLGVEPVAQVEEVLLLAVDDLAQAEEVALLRERALVGGLNHALALLVELPTQGEPLGLERRDPSLQLAGARVRGPLLVRDHLHHPLQITQLTLQIRQPLILRRRFHRRLRAVPLVVQDVLGQRRNLAAEAHQHGVLVGIADRRRRRRRRVRPIAAG